MEFFYNFSYDSVILLFAYLIICISSFYLSSQLKKFGLPLVTALIIVGLIIGPDFIGIINNEIIKELEFMFDLSLGFIAFAAGSELFFKEIKSSINSIKWNTLSSILITFIVSFILIFLVLNSFSFFDNIQLNIKLYMSLLCASISVARSPASAIAVINELKAKGKFTSTSMGVLCLSDIGVILLFSIIFSLVKSIDSGSLELLSVLIIVFEIIFSLLLGLAYGLLINLFMNISVNKSVKHFLLVLIGFSTFILTEFIRDFTFLIFNKEIIFEPLLICMVCGIYLVNKTDKRLEFLNFIQESGKYIYVIFFTLIGASLNLFLVFNVFQYALLFFIIRLFSLFIASYFGGYLANDNLSNKLLGWTPHITQAGVSLGLIQLIQKEFNYWENEIVSQLSIILISSIIISQFVGPPIFKWALNFLQEANRRKNILLSKKKRVIIFGLEPQSISVASLLKSRGWIVDIITFETNKLLKVPKGINQIKIESVDKYNFDNINYSTVDSAICFSSDKINEEICKLSYSTYGNKNLIVRINEYSKADVFSNFNIKLIHPSDAIINLIDQYVRSPLATSIFLGKEKDKEIRDIRLLNEKISGSLLRDLKLPQDVLMLSIKRSDEIILSHGYTRLLKEDIITFLGSKNSLDKLTLRFDS